MNVAITFNPDGMAHGLYTEAIDLSAIGTLTIKRASTIEFDNDRQVWRVADLKGHTLHDNPSRQACIDWEHDYFNGGPHE